MRYLLLSSVFFCFWGSLSAQTAEEIIQQDIHCSASCDLAYPGLIQIRMTEVPEGKKPFYISHYGRHGSRYLTQEKAYRIPVEILAKADSLGKLTVTGKDVLGRLTMLYEESEKRWGELTPLGARQQQQIAKRMYERFPEVFQGDVSVDAKSVRELPCILSMENALIQLIMVNPSLRIRHDASNADKYYLNFHDRNLAGQDADSAIQAQYQSSVKKYDHSMQLMMKMFNDMEYVRNHVDARQLSNDLFLLASHIQNMESRKKITLYDLFSDEEVYDYWMVRNMEQFVKYGGYTPNGAVQPYSQRYLLRKMIEEADSCIRSGQPGASLRFGTEKQFLPFVCLLELDGYGLQTDRLEHLVRKDWVDFKICPMAANIQFVFYRKDSQDQDVLVKVLLNENEARLPVKSNDRPYYKWSDIRDYYLKKIDAYKD